MCGFRSGRRGQGAVPGPQLYVVVRLLPYCAKKKEGPRALYRGYAPTLWSFGAFSGLYWAFYEQLRPSDTSVSFADALPCALTAGAACVVAGRRPGPGRSSARRCTAARTGRRS